MSVNKVTITPPATGSTLTIADGKTLTVTQNTSLDEAVAMSSKAPKTDVIIGDGIASRILRMSNLYITNGTNADTIKCQLINVWNGDAIVSTDNIGKGATTGDFNLSADGKSLKILNSGISGVSVAVLATTMYLDSSNMTWIYVSGEVSGGDILIGIFNDHVLGQIDLTTLAGTTFWQIFITYLTSA